jgi:hypothetical protein
MGGHDDLIPHNLSPGWQAKLALYKHENGFRISKAFGVGCGWRRGEAVSIGRCAERYSQWLTMQGVLVLRPTEQRIQRRGDEWLYLVSQPYLGLDCDVRLKHASVHEFRSRIVEQLIRAGLQVAFPKHGPLFRGEIKPRDFCLSSDGSTVLIDSFPPVLARNGRRFVAASRHHTRSCAATRERDEVLAVTGSPFGILRNLCEHLLSIAPVRRELILRQVLPLIGAACPRTSRELASYLQTDRSVQKVKVLARRRNRFEER